jgi:hypothetical protein
MSSLFKEEITKEINQKELAQEIKEVIEGYTSNLSFKIKLAARLNQSLKIMDDGDLEALLSIAHNTMCCGSGGSGYDHDDHGEVKGTSFVQSWKCRCKKKISFFKNVCPYCSGLRTKIPRDGRWGIQARTHNKYINELKEYRLHLIEPLIDDADCKQFMFRHWTIKNNCKHLGLYANKQIQGNSNNINFQPLKQDFYMCNPILKYSGILNIENNKTVFDFHYFDMFNKKSEKMPPKYANKNSHDIIENKNIGKDRGVVIRI